MDRAGPAFRPAALRPTKDCGHLRRWSGKFDTKRRNSISLLQARRRAEAMGVTINGLVRLDEEADLADYYNKRVIMGHEKIRHGYIELRGLCPCDQGEAHQGIIVSSRPPRGVIDLDRPRICHDGTTLWRSAERKARGRRRVAAGCQARKDYAAYGPCAVNGRQFDELLMRLDSAEDEQRRKSPIRR